MLDTQSTQLQTWHAGTAAEEAAYEHVLNSKLSELGVQVAGRDALHIMFILTPSQKRIFFFGSPIDGVSEKCVFSCKHPLRCSPEQASQSLPKVRKECRTNIGCTTPPRIFAPPSARWRVRSTARWKPLERPSTKTSRPCKKGSTGRSPRYSLTRASRRKRRQRRWGCANTASSESKLSSVSGTICLNERKIGHRSLLMVNGRRCFYSEHDDRAST